MYPFGCPVARTDPNKVFRFVTYTTCHDLHNDIEYIYLLLSVNMSCDNMKAMSKDAPPPPVYLDAVVRWLETNVRKPIEGSWLDTWVATPAKQYYIGAKRLE